MNGPLPAAGGPPIRVLMFDTLSGTNDYSNELIEALAETGEVALTVLTVESSRLPPDLPARVLRLLPDFGAPIAPWRKAVRLLRAYAAFLAAGLRHPRGLVVHVQFFKFAWLEAPLLLLLRALGARLVHTAHNALPHVPRRWHRRFYRWWYGRVDAVHVLSANVENDIRGPVGAEPRRVERIEHGSYRRLLQRHGAGTDRAGARARLGLPAEGLVVLQYGLFRGYKGLGTLMHAFCQLPRDLGARLLLAGGGYPDELAAWRAIPAAAGCADRVHWLDRYVSDEELCTCLRAADVAVFPYREVSQSGALILALTFGLPCVANDLPGFREALAPLDDGFFRRDDPTDLARHLQALATDALRLQRLRDGQAAEAAQRHDWAGIARRTVALYASLTPPRA